MYFDKNCPLVKEEQVISLFTKVSFSSICLVHEAEAGLVSAEEYHDAKVDIEKLFHLALELSNLCHVDDDTDLIMAEMDANDCLRWL